MPVGREVSALIVMAKTDQHHRGHLPSQKGKVVVLNPLQRPLKDIGHSLLAGHLPDQVLQPGSRVKIARHPKLPIPHDVQDHHGQKLGQAAFAPPLADQLAAPVEPVPTAPGDLRLLAIKEGQHGRSPQVELGHDSPQLKQTGYSGATIVGSHKLEIKDFGISVGPKQDGTLPGHLTGGKSGQQVDHGDLAVGRDRFERLLLDSPAKAHQMLRYVGAQPGQRGRTGRPGAQLHLGSHMLKSFLSIKQAH